MMTKCELCDQPAWYRTYEPSFERQHPFYCGQHRAEAYAKQRQIWGFPAGLREQDVLVGLKEGLTASPQPGIMSAIPNNPTLEEDQ